MCWIIQFSEFILRTISHKCIKIYAQERTSALSVAAKPLGNNSKVHHRRPPIKRRIGYPKPILKRKKYFPPKSFENRKKIHVYIHCMHRKCTITFKNEHIVLHCKNSKQLLISQLHKEKKSKPSDKIMLNQHITSKSNMKSLL